MKRLAAALTAFALAMPGWAQEQAEQGTAAVLRALDKVNGHSLDAEVAIGSSAEMFGLLVSVHDCRYPAENPTGDAFAYLSVRDPKNGAEHFQGWMIASSPALNALDHNRYDVWVIRCKSS
ncbi:DUF2155 domain-containing protein [Leisingera daeponensis]|uniref:DUF2155 domain-containing protein n=1 Tax=Leisingera daeponensis TaxID=405746 RepID=UPI001C947C45|nr:DUF2155 domain-containing protein [Leisingera daeponensis]MBY6055721.1 DUF2155 domain-containing protein [Leisingera daeponensis]